MTKEEALGMRGQNAIGGMVGCLIASVARRNEATLLAQDIDLSRVANVAGIQLDSASLAV